MRFVIRMSKIGFTTLLLSLILFAAQSPVAAATLTVSNTADTGAGSLRQAIIDATTNAAANTIDFNIPLTDPGYSITTNRFTISLVNQLPDIPLAPTIIDNTTGRGVTVKGNNTFRIFTLVNSAVVHINNLTISQGSSSGGLGGGIYMGNSATLFLNNCVVSNNSATNGGGGIWVNDSGTLHLTDTTISNNSTSNGDGGGIHVHISGTLNITASTVNGNTATIGSGGGIFNGVSGTVNATNITLSGNTAGDLGGGMINNATTTISSCTISGNTAPTGGGGIYNSMVATINNSLVALNTGADGPDLLGRGSRGANFTGNSNLVGNADGSGGLGPTTNQLGTTASPINPQLGPLQNNGGPTSTYALLNGSPAIDAGTTALATDQRGVARPQNGDLLGGAQSDIGSFELQSGLVINDVTVTEPVTGTVLAVFTVTLSPARSVPVSVDFTTANVTATAGSDYTTTFGTLVFAVGETTKTVTVTVLSDVTLESPETFDVNLSNAQGGGVLIADSQGVGTILDASGSPTPTPTPTPLTSVQFSTAVYSAVESANSLTITVTRTGDLTGVTTVDFMTNDSTATTVRCDDVTGLATQHCDYETASGVLTFAAGESTKDVVILLWDDAHVELGETFSVSLANALGASIGSPGTTVITLTDNDILPTSINPSDANAYFVRMQYLDFLYREPEIAGFNAWMAVLNNCSDVNNNPLCDRVTVSGSFFRSDEFQLKGYYVYRFYRVAFGRLPTYQEFMRDLRRVTGSTEAEVIAALPAYAAEFRNRADFRARYDANTNDAYVDALQTTVGVQVSISQQLKDGLNAGTKTRADVLREIVATTEVYNKEYNGGFVAAQYFGYLRRDPEIGGYNAWLLYLNAHPTDYRTMVNGFVKSTEYRLRFGTP